MKNYLLQKLPLGKSDFSMIRKRGAVYVDKTDLVYRLATGNSERIFLARPRRFGKSMLVSTFESLFKFGIRDFQGLAIEKLWNEKTYNVVHLDFSGIKAFSSCEIFKEKFYEKLRYSFEPAGFQYDASGGSVIGQLSAWMQRGIEDDSFVLLIDEYDAPLTACLDRPLLFEAVQAEMSDFFAELKSNDRCLRFLFLTGITKFSSTGIFSGFNNLKDISLDPAYSELLGYTENELRRYFGPHLRFAAETLQISATELVEKLREHYDGFSFDPKGRTHVFCPWSVLSFFDSVDFKFDNYWFQTGGQPAVLQKYLLTHKLSDPRTFTEERVVFISDLSSANAYDRLGQEILLTQAGYLTIKSGNDFQVRLGYPNIEVASSMAMLYARELLKPGASVMRADGANIDSILSSGSIEEVIEQFNRVFLAVDYQNYPVTDEASCRSHLQVLLIGAGINPIVEQHNAFGRSDLELIAGNRHWVFEFKYAKTPSQESEALASAVQQIERRHYGESSFGRHLIRVALVFTESCRQITRWRSV